MAGTLALGVAACGGGSGDKAGPSTTKAPKPTTTGTTAPPTTSRDQLKQQILADYKKALDAFHDSVITANPDLPALAATHNGQNLATVKAAVARLKEQGFVGVDGPHSRLTDRAVVTRVLEASATVQDCRIDDSKVINQSTGQVVDDKVTTESIRAELVEENGSWKVSKSDLVKQSEGISGCASSTNS